MLPEWRGTVKGSGLQRVELASVTRLSTSFSPLVRESNGEKCSSLLEEAIGVFHKDAYFNTFLIWQLLPMRVCIT